MSVTPESGRPRVSPLYDPKIRSLAYQVLLCAVLGFIVYQAVSTGAVNLEKARIASGFGFWNNVAGFDISQTMIQYSPSISTYGRAFWVGLINTLLVSVAGIILATV